MWKGEVGGGLEEKRVRAAFWKPADQTCGILPQRQRGGGEGLWLGEIREENADEVFLRKYKIMISFLSWETHVKKGALWEDVRAVGSRVEIWGGNTQKRTTSTGLDLKKTHQWVNRGLRSPPRGQRSDVLAVTCVMGQMDVDGGARGRRRGWRGEGGQRGERATWRESGGKRGGWKISRLQASVVRGPRDPLTLWVLPQEGTFVLLCSPVRVRSLRDEIDRERRVCCLMLTHTLWYGWSLDCDSVWNECFSQPVHFCGSDRNNTHPSQVPVRYNSSQWCNHWKHKDDTCSRHCVMCLCSWSHYHPSHCCSTSFVLTL